MQKAFRPSAQVLHSTDPSFPPHTLNQQTNRPHHSEAIYTSSPVIQTIVKTVEKPRSEYF